MPKQVLNAETFLAFLGVPYRIVSQETEICTTCPACGKADHLYIQRQMQVFFCQRCGETGTFQQFLMLYVEQWAKQAEALEYFSQERGLPAEVVEGLQLGYCPILDRYTIPYWASATYDGEIRVSTILNVAFRARREDQDPKYLRLPGVRVAGFVLDHGRPTKTLIVEGEIDAISVFAALPQVPQGLRIIGTSAGTLTKDIKENVVGPVRAIYDNDTAGRAGARKARKVLGAEVLALPENYKDINEMYVHDPAALATLITSTDPRLQVPLDLDTDDAPPSADDMFAGLVAHEYIVAPDEDVPWLVEDLWYDKAIGFIAGIPKSLKSTLAANLAVAVAGRGEFLGHKVRKNGVVLFFQEEDADFVTRERLSSLLADNSEAASRLYVFTPTTMRENLLLSSPESVEKLENTIAYYKPTLVILDPFANISGVDDENKSVEVNRLLEILRHMRDKYGTSIAIVHHMRKVLPGESAVWGQRMRGSGVFHAKTECALYTEVSDGIVYIRAEAKTRPMKEILARYVGRGRFEVLTPPEGVG